MAVTNNLVLGQLTMDPNPNFINVCRYMDVVYNTHYEMQSTNKLNRQFSKRKGRNF